MGLNWSYDINVSLEDGFKISIETDDIVDLVFKKGYNLKI